MFALILGTAGFVLFLLYDINSYSINHKLLNCSFTAGIFLISISTVLLLHEAWKLGGFSAIEDLGLLLLSILAFGALLYCLFFALPFQDTYSRPQKGRHTYMCGVYAACRHPGVICFFFMYLFLGIAALPAKLLLVGIWFSALNCGYAWFQDKITFPKTFCDYDIYRKKVPFLIPTKNSIGQAIQTWGSPYKKEVEL